MPSAHQNIQYLGASGYIGAYTTTGGGGSTVVPRSDLDFLRMGIGRTPQAEYPDGYLGNIRSRRDDRGMPTDTVLDSLKNRQNQRAYQRGVHRGERIDPAQYLWPAELRPDRRLRAKFQVVEQEGAITLNVTRNAPRQELAPAPSLINDGKANIRANEPAEITGQQFAHLRPQWN